MNDGGIQFYQTVMQEREMIDGAEWITVNLGELGSFGAEVEYENKGGKPEIKYIWLPGLGDIVDIFGLSDKIDDRAYEAAQMHIEYGVSK